MILVDTELILSCFAPAPSRWWVVVLALTHYEKLIGLFKTPIGNLLLNSFKSSEVYHYTVLNGTLKSRCFPAFPVQAM